MFQQSFNDDVLVAIGDSIFESILETLKVIIVVSDNLVYEA